MLQFCAACTIIPHYLNPLTLEVCGTAGLVYRVSKKRRLLNRVCW